MDKIKEIEKFARGTFSKNGMNWFAKLHIEVVEKFAFQLADIKNANKDIIKLSVWLHDIDHTREKVSKIHHIENSEFAGKLLKEKGFDESTIEAVKHCIINHRCKDEYIPESIEAKILASADAMSHIEKFDTFLYVALYMKNLDKQKAYDWLQKKIAKDWNNKILVPEGKEIVKEKHKEVLVLLDEMKRDLGHQ